MKEPMSLTTLTVFNYIMTSKKCNINKSIQVRSRYHQCVRSSDSIFTILLSLHLSLKSPARHYNMRFVYTLQPVCLHDPLTEQQHLGLLSWVQWQLLPYPRRTKIII